MGRSIHGRIRNGEWQYREWSSIVDAYTTDPMTETQCREYMLQEYSEREIEYGVPERDVPTRFARVHAKGSSAFDADAVDLNGPWETERCEGRGGCGGFHHAFELRKSDGLCSYCGEPENDRSHGEPCIERAVESPE